VVRSFAGDACLDALVAHGWHDPVAQPDDPRWRRGRGMAALAIVTAAAGAAHADESHSACRVEADGTVVVETGIVEMGTGNHSTFASVAAAALGVDVAQVRVEHQASSVAPTDEGTFASRSVYVSANAVAAAARALRASIIDAVSARTGVAAGDLKVVPGGVIAGGVALPWSSVVPLRADGTAIVGDNGLVAGAQMVDVAVDTVTGRVRVERVVSAHDVGRVIDADMARGQVVGGVVQGIGIALSEQCRHDAGLPLDPHLLHQLLPTTTESPEVVAVFVGDGTAGGALGAKGLGEAPIVGMPAAIANAVFDAVGVRLRRAPFPPEVVAAALAAARGSWTSAARATATVSSRCASASATARSASPAR
jgi:CO/xanthine dehydrogenase Mo-binding subunit